MSDDTGAAEAVESPQSDEGTEAAAEAAPSIEERLDSLEQHVAAALAGAASGAEFSSQLAGIAEDFGRQLDELGARVDELGGIVTEHAAGPVASLLEDDDDDQEHEPEDAAVTCEGCGRRADAGAAVCPRCGAALGDPIA